MDVRKDVSLSIRHSRGRPGTQAVRISTIKVSRDFISQLVMRSHYEKIMLAWQQIRACVLL